jgi:glycerol-3-phosphate dehydrogenase
VWSYAGLRPLFDDEAADASKISRDYALSLDHGIGAAPILSIFGGKITTHRALAADVMDRLADFLPALAPGWTADAILPGGDLGGRGLSALTQEIETAAPFLGSSTGLRLAQAYGSRVWRILRGVRTPADMGRSFGGGLTQAEVDYLVREEWAYTPDDILWRRSKLGLHLRPEEIDWFENWFAGEYGENRTNKALQG